MTIEEDQARAIGRAIKRARATDEETLRDIMRITRHSKCAVCRAIHVMVAEQTGLIDRNRRRAQES